MLYESVIEVLYVLRQRKLRTVLTALSVAWGMFMLALLLGVGRGLQNGAEWEFRNDAIASVLIRSAQTSVPFAGRGSGREVKLTVDDYSALRRDIRGIGTLSGTFQLWGEFHVSYGKQRSAFEIRGTYPENRVLEKVELLRGRYLNALDLRLRRKVAVIGSKVTESLFGAANPIGEHIEIRGVRYLVVGEFADIGGQAQLRHIYVPITTAQLLYSDPGRVHSLAFTLRTDDLEESQRISTAARELLAKRHGIAPDDRQALRIHNNLEKFYSITRVFSWIRVFVWCVGTGTLLAAIVGVSNILFISVAERTREFGVRKALGARSHQIVASVVFEAVIIATVSGYAGLFSGIGAVKLVSLVAGQVPFLRNPEVELALVIPATLVLIAAGAFAGALPAARAARVDPIVALRQGN